MSFIEGLSMQKNKTVLSNDIGFFRLEKYGYSLGRVLNDPNRWSAKIVCGVFDRASRHYASTTYTKKHDYHKFLETTSFLGCNNTLYPEIKAIYAKEATVVCEYIGQSLQDYLSRDLHRASFGIEAVFKYLNDLNSISRIKKIFSIPSIVRTGLELSKELGSDFEFLPKCRKLLPEMERSGIEFDYGYGIEDPHIWNFRIIENSGAPHAFTTDFDFFCEDINWHWELGYLYATLRWLRKTEPDIADRAKERLVVLTQGKKPEDDFMFWLGVLSSYCGYKDSLRNLLTDGEPCELEEEREKIKELDEKVAILGGMILSRKEMKFKWRHRPKNHRLQAISLLGVAGSKETGGVN